MKEDINDDIKRLEKRIKDTEDFETNQVWLTADVHALRNLIARYKKLEKRSDMINSQNIKYQNTLEKLQKETIWKSKVREKIKKVNNSNENYTFYKLTSADIRKTITINLEELLQEGDTNETKM